MNASKPEQSVQDTQVCSGNAQEAYQKYQQEMEAQQTDENRSKAFYWLQCAAEAGHPQAQYQLGRELTFSDDSIAMVVYWLQKAAKQGVGDAFAKLDELYARGHQNVPTRIDKAKLYAEAAPALQIAADAGDSAAAIEFAVCCQHGYGVVQDKVKAFQLYLQAAETGNQKAQYRLAECYESGTGVRQDVKRADEIYKRLDLVVDSKKQVETGIKLLQNNDAKSKTEAFEHFKQAATIRNPEGCYQTGQCYQNGVGVQKDVVVAVNSYKQSAERGHKLAAVRLAQFYATKQAKPESAEYAFELYRETAETAGNDVQFELAQCYENGTGTRRSPQLAAELYRNLLKSGHIKALSRLISMHQNGLLGDPHSDEAVKMYISGLEKQNAEAMCELAHCCYENRVSDEVVKQIEQNQVFKTIVLKTAKEYANGFAEPVSDEHMFAALKLAENQNAPDVLCALGRCCNFGWGVEKNVAKAVEYYTKAADVGSYEAIERLGDCKDKNVDEQLEAAFEHFKQLADAGNVAALLNIGYCYYDGIGCNTNFSQTANTLQQAVSSGNSNAMVSLSEMYKYGHCVEEDEAKAVELYKQAADAGNTEEQYRLGYCYHYAIGVDEDYKQAAFWYEKAAAQGHAGAASKLGYCYYMGYGVEKNMVNAFQCSKQAAIAGSDYGQHNTGACYHIGKGIKQNYEQAVYWYQKAVDQGNPYAGIDLQHCLEQLRETRNVCTDLQCAESEFKSTQSVSANQQHTVGFYLAKLAANLGNNRAFSCLGNCYFSGTGTKRDINAAAKCYERVKQSDSQTLLNLARCYATGAVIDRNELNLFSALKQANAALRGEINGILLQMQ